MKQAKSTIKESVSIIVPKYCPYCGSPSVSYSAGGSICLSCGASFLAARVGPRPAIHDFVEGNSFDTGSVPLSVPREPPPHGLSEIDKALNALDVQENTRKEARAIYRRAYAMGAAHGRKSVEGLAAASVYAACKQSGLPKPLDEIAATLDVDKMEVERAYTYLVNEMGYLPTYSITDNETAALNKPRLESSFPAGGVMDLHGLDVAKFLEKKGTYEFLRLLKEKPRRWKTLEKELALSPRTLSERISQALELGFIEKVRRLKIGATYYRLTGKGNDIFEAMTGDTRIY